MRLSRALTSILLAWALVCSPTFALAQDMLLLGVGSPKGGATTVLPRNPCQIFGSALGGWADLTDAGTVTTNAGGVSSLAAETTATGCSGLTQAIFPWTQSTASNQPPYTSAQYMNFSAGNYALTPATWQAAPWAAIWVGTASSAATGFNTPLTNGSSDYHAISNNSAQYGGAHFGSPGFVQAGSLTLPVSTLGGFLVEVSSGLGFSGNTNGSSVSSAAVTFTSGAVTRIGSDGTNFSGKWTEIAVFNNTSVTTAQIQEAEGCLYLLAGALSKLPNGHPWKNSALGGGC